MEKRVSFMENNESVCELLNKDETDFKTECVIEISLPPPQVVDQCDILQQEQPTKEEDGVVTNNKSSEDRIDQLIKNLENMNQEMKESMSKLTNESASLHPSYVIHGVAKKLDQNINKSECIIHRLNHISKVLEENTQKNEIISKTLDIFKLEALDTPRTRNSSNNLLKTLIEKFDNLNIKVDELNETNRRLFVENVELKNKFNRQQKLRDEVLDIERLDRCKTLKDIKEQQLYASHQQEMILSTLKDFSSSGCENKNDSFFSKSFMISPPLSPRLSRSSSDRPLKRVDRKTGTPDAFSVFKNGIHEHNNVFERSRVFESSQNEKQISPTNTEDDMLLFKFSDSDQFGAKSKENNKGDNNKGYNNKGDNNKGDNNSGDNNRGDNNRGDNMSKTNSKEDDESTKCFNKLPGPLSQPFSSGSGISFGWNFWPPPPAYAAVLSEDDNDVKYNTNLFFKRSCSSSVYCEKLDSKLTGDDNEDEIDIDSI